MDAARAVMALLTTLLTSNAVAELQQICAVWHLFIGDAMRGLGASSAHETAHCKEDIHKLMKASVLARCVSVTVSSAFH